MAAEQDGGDIPRHSASVMLALEASSINQSLLDRLTRVLTELVACQKDAKHLMSVVKVRARKGEGAVPTDSAECSFIREAVANSVVKLSQKMSDFISDNTSYTPVDMCMPKKDVTKAIHAYIRGNNLVSPTSKKDIIANQALATLFEIEPATVITWFSVQSHIGKLLDRSDEAQAANKVIRAATVLKARDEYRAMKAAQPPVEEGAEEEAPPPVKKARKASTKPRASKKQRAADGAEAVVIGEHIEVADEVF